MDGMVVALLVGALLEMIGLGLAAVGFRQTWLEHGRSERFLGPLTKQVAATRAKAARWIRRLSGRPVVHTIDVHDGAHALSTVTADLELVWGALLPDAADLPAFAEEVQRRLNDLHKMAQDAEHALAAERSARANAEAALRAELATQGERIEEMTHQVAVGGLRLQVAGWIFVFLGVFVGSVAQVVESWSG